MAKGDLTVNQEKFCQAMFELGNATEAYIEVLGEKPCTKRSTIVRNAGTMLHRPQVQARLKELEDMAAEKSIWNREKSIIILANIAESKKTKESDKINAVKEINSMNGWKGETVDHKSSDGSMSPVKEIKRTIVDCDTEHKNA